MTRNLSRRSRAKHEAALKISHPDRGDNPPVRLRHTRKPCLPATAKRTSQQKKEKIAQIRPAETPASRLFALP
jgi:hypothetical protein